MSLSIKPKETGVAWKTRFAVRQSAKLEQKPSGATWWEISVKCSWQSFSFQSLNRAHVQLCKFWEDLKRSNSSHTPYVQHMRLKRQHMRALPTTDSKCHIEFFIESHFSLSPSLAYSLFIFRSLLTLLKSTHPSQLEICCSCWSAVLFLQFHNN